jgi:uncharacterized membrane protein
MPPVLNEWLQNIFRWFHVIAGITWIGHLYFFNFVNAQVAKTYDADSKKKVLPELMPRALYWFRWGAAYTWITGVLLLALVYYHGGMMVQEQSKQGLGTGAQIGIGLGVSLLAFFIYDVLWKSPLAKNEMVGAMVSLVLIITVALVFSMVMPGRAMFIHLGAMFGTLMAMNVWMRIWPAQRKIIGGVKGTNPAPDAAVPAQAGLRSKHNTYLSVPLVLFMISNHFPSAYGHDLNWVIAIGFVLVGWGMAKFFYTKSASPAPAQF